MNKKGIVIITGVGMNEAKFKFKYFDSAEIVGGHTQGKKAKINSPAATSILLSEKGYIPFMLGDCENCLRHLSNKFLKGENYYRKFNLLKKEEFKDFVKELKELKEKTKLPIHIVHYGGMSGKQSGIHLPKETVALSPWEIPSEAIGPYVESNCSSLINLIQEIRPLIKEQKLTKLIIISAVSSIRTKRLHTLDAIQKAAVHSMARSFALDLTKENIYVTEIMPGITDTGFYDNEETLEAMFLAGEEFGYKYTKENFPLLNPKRVAEAVLFALDFIGHIREITFMPYGQYPHLGA
ncbi:MAG: SDR family oxidoreductase [Candidatus Pacearchaeota archaeon]